jgi:3,4-dihydroxy 2-butanone 4-phosphate synthase/GTP cyclohydrolase II
MRNVCGAGPVELTTCLALDQADPRRSRGFTGKALTVTRLASSSAAKAIQDIRAGRPVVLLGDSGQDGEADLVFAAAASTEALMSACVRLTSGFVGVALPADRCDQLWLPLQHWSQFAHRPPQCVAVDAVGVGTGISARDRSRTAQVLADPHTTHEQLTRPGHVVPLRAGAGSDYVDAGVRLTLSAGLPGAAVISRLVSEEDPTEMARGPEVLRIARRHQLRTVAVSEILCQHNAIADAV